MNNNKGFTLTEILLAAMVVGIIGIALAAITTAGIREGKTGRTKAIMRNQLSTTLRQLRQDIDLASSVTVGQNGRELKLVQTHPLGPWILPHPIGLDEYPKTITYTFTVGTTDSGGGKIGGTLTRQVGGNAAEVILPNVKSISGGDFVSPSFALRYEDATDNYNAVSSVLRVCVIVEVAGSPVINEVIDETFLLPHGIPIRK